MLGVVTFGNTTGQTSPGDLDTPGSTRHLTQCNTGHLTCCNTTLLSIYLYSVAIIESHRLRMHCKYYLCLCSHYTEMWSMLLFTAPIPCSNEHSTGVQGCNTVRMDLLFCCLNCLLLFILILFLGFLFVFCNLSIFFTLTFSNILKLFLCTYTAIIQDFLCPKIFST